MQWSRCAASLFSRTSSHPFILLTVGEVSFRRSHHLMNLLEKNQMTLELFGTHGLLQSFLDSLGKKNRKKTKKKTNGSKLFFGFGVIMNIFLVRYSKSTPNLFISTKIPLSSYRCMSFRFWKSFRRVLKAVIIVVNLPRASKFYCYWQIPNFSISLGFLAKFYCYWQILNFGISLVLGMYKHLYNFYLV